MLSEEEAERLRKIESDLHDLANARLVETYGVPVSNRADRNEAADKARIAAREGLMDLAMKVREFRQSMLSDNDGGSKG